MNHDFKRLTLFITLAIALPAIGQSRDVDLGSVEVTASRDATGANPSTVGAQTIQRSEERRVGKEC